jgi:hypothetical protein
MRRVNTTARVWTARRPKSSVSPCLVSVPLNPGKNLTVICEVVAMNHLLRHGG